MLYLFVDCETNGLPTVYDAPPDLLENWPRILQLAWLLSDSSGNVVEEGNCLVDPAGRFKLDKEAQAVNNLSEEALSKGGSSVDMLREFIRSLGKSHILVAHNVSFDNSVIQSELYRYKQSPAIARMDAMDKICTMRQLTDYCALPGKYEGSFKWPSLSELYYQVFQSDLVEAHNAVSDVRALHKCFFELKKQGHI